MKIKFFLFLAFFSILLESRVLSYNDEQSVIVEYYPKEKISDLLDFEKEDDHIVKNIYINVPDGKVDVKVVFEGKEKGKNFYGNFDYKKTNAIYKKEFVYASRQRILHLKIYPVYACDKEDLYFYSKFKIEVKFEKKLEKADKADPLTPSSVNSDFFSTAFHYPKFEELKIKYYLKLEILEDALYRIEYDDLKNAGYNPELIDPKEISLFSRRDLFLPADTPDMFYFKDPKPEPFIFFGDDDNRFEKGEYFIFYGRSIKGKGKNFYSSIDLYNNPFTDYNQYILTFNKDEQVKIKEFTFLNSGGDSITELVKIFRYDSINPLMAGFGWAWRSFELKKDSTISDYIWNFKLDGISSKTGILTVSFFFQTDYNDTFDIDIELNGIIVGRASSRGAYTTLPKEFSFNVFNLEENNSLRIIPLNTDNRNKTFYLCSVQIDHTINLNQAEEVKIENKSEDKDLVLYSDKKGFFLYQKTPYGDYFASVGKNEKRIFKLYPNSETFISTRLKKVDRMEYVDCTDIADFYEGCDVLIITKKGFKNATNSYVLHRKMQNVKVKVFEFERIDDLFSFGMRHFASIKSFLYFAQKRWLNFPKYLILLGSGSYDYKNRKNTYENRNIVPAYETGYGVYKLDLLTTYRSECTDRWFSLLTPDNYIDIIPGRITVLNQDQVYPALKKIIDYETKTPVDIKNKALVISDDEYSSRLTSDYNDILFLSMSEELSNLLGNIFAVKKLYLTDYRGDLEKTDHWPYNPGFKRDVRFVLRDILSDGVNFGFFYGHGSYYSLTHEHILEYPTDIDLFDNIFKYPVFLFGTCQAGQFDNDYGCIAGDFQILPYSGFSATIAATRATGAGENQNILYNSFAHDLFLYGGYKTLGEYYLSMINANNNIYTSHQIFGDPSMVIKKYAYDVEILSPETLNLGSYNKIGFKSQNEKNDEIFIDIYQPFYTDSHDYTHIYPYSYFYYTKTDGVSYKIKDLSKENLFNIYLPDTFSNKKYQPFMNITSVYEDDTLIHSKIKRVYYVKKREDVLSQSNINLYINGVKVYDTIVCPDEYKLTVEFYSKNGLYTSNLDEYKPVVYFTSDYKRNLNSFVLYKDTFKLDLFVDTAYSFLETLRVVLYDNLLKRYEKKVFLKHPKDNPTKEIYVYPNPFENSFYITFTSNSSGFIIYRIIDEYGNLIFANRNVVRKDFNSLKVEIKKNIPLGVYLLSIEIFDMENNRNYFKNIKIVKR